MIFRRMETKELNAAVEKNDICLLLIILQKRNDLMETIEAIQNYIPLLLKGTLL